MMIHSRHLVLMVTVVAAIAGAGPHATVEAATINPEADSYIDANSKTANYGTNVQLRAKYDPTTFTRKSYIRFNLSALTFDHTTQLQDATLNLNFFDTDAGSGGTGITWEFEVFGLEDGDAGENWGETSINWNNAPANDAAGTSNDILLNAPSLGTFSFLGRTAVVAFTGTGGTAVRNFVAASSDNDLVTFIVRRNTVQPNQSNSYVHAASSRNHTTEPIPSLDLTPIPEPSTLALAVLGVLGLARRKK